MPLYNAGCPRGFVRRSTEYSVDTYQESFLFYGGTPYFCIYSTYGGTPSSMVKYLTYSTSFVLSTVFRTPYSVPVLYSTPVHR